MSTWAEDLSKWFLADICPAYSSRKKVDVPQLPQTIYLFQQVIIITFKIFNLAVPCCSLRSLLIFYLWLKKGCYLFPLCAKLLAGLSWICLSLTWQVELSSLSVSHRPWSLSLRWYCVPVNSLQPVGFLKWGNKNWQRPMPKREWRTITLFTLLFCHSNMFHWSSIWPGSLNFTNFSCK